MPQSSNSMPRHYITALTCAGAIPWSKSKTAHYLLPNASAGDARDFQKYCLSSLPYWESCLKEFPWQAKEPKLLRRYLEVIVCLPRCNPVSVEQPQSGFANCTANGLPGRTDILPHSSVILDNLLWRGKHTGCQGKRFGGLSHGKLEGCCGHWAALV